MICKSCGTDIADKAIVCYRCGAATSEPKRRPPSPPSGQHLLAMRLSLGVAMAAIIAVAVLVLPGLEEDWQRAAGFAAVAVATLIVSRAIRRSFRR